MNGALTAAIQVYKLVISRYSAHDPPPTVICSRHRPAVVCTDCAVRIVAIANVCRSPDNGWYSASQAGCARFFSVRCGDYGPCFIVNRGTAIRRHLRRQQRDRRNFTPALLVTWFPACVLSIWLIAVRAGNDGEMTSISLTVSGSRQASPAAVFCTGIILRHFELRAYHPHP